MAAPNVAMMTDDEIAELAEQAANRQDIPSGSTSMPKAQENKRFGTKPNEAWRNKPTINRGIILREPPKHYEVVDVTPNIPHEDQWNKFFAVLKDVPNDKAFAVYPEPDQSAGNLQLQIRRAAKRHGVSITTSVRNKVVYVRMA